MDLPRTIPMPELLHGNGGPGNALYIEGSHGVQRVTRCVKHHWSTEWRHEQMPDHVFASLSDLAEAWALVTPEQADAERARWPQLLKDERVPLERQYSNACRLCPTPRAPEERRVHIGMDWTGVHDHHAGLCGNHYAMHKDDLPGLLRALQAEIEERKARAKPLLEGPTT